MPYLLKITEENSITKLFYYYPCKTEDFITYINVLSEHTTQQTFCHHWLQQHNKQQQNNNKKHTLLWSRMRSSTISSVFRDLLKACSSSISSAGRLPVERSIGGKHKHLFNFLSHNKMEWKSCSCSVFLAHSFLLAQH